ncbi:mismatch-specific DNA-glycosylase [Paenibacillus provencensis]|uniref:Mismatch-specific DNA-glycosylase n=1 Tax=Paenibacillus provencensis TaxID=441151 RepID=A0ABW3PYE5_9BACL|nr:mismatch-specific DNA-glycosylase [Paenibacillus sp. MER 78]MCM3127840.1 mismatch-specific DNA-glycosylase [Paenibacillus sp. MER 78]
MEAILDHLEPGLQIVFIGFNPSIRSGETGHHYANPRNNFYRILYQAGLTPRLYQAQEDQDLLKLGYGFTNIVARPTKGIEDITKEEYAEGRILLKNKLEKYRPEVACFVGKGVYAQYAKKTKADWGFQPEPFLTGMHEFVAPSSSGLVRMPMTEIIDIYKQLSDYIHRERS